MAERPDLDAIGRNLVNWEDQTLGQFMAWPDELLDLLCYCRELEAENKRLRERLDAADKADAKRHANWLAAAGDCGP